MMGVVRLVSSSSAVPHPPAQPKLTISAGSQRCVLPLAPVPTAHGGMGWVWQPVDRGGRKSLVVPVGQKNRTLEFPNLVVGYTSHQHSIDRLLLQLERIANLNARVAVSYARPERGLWVLQDFSYTIDLRQEGTNAATRATVNMKFTEYVELPKPIGPARPAPAAHPTPAKPKSGAGTGGAVARYWSVRAGQTLWSIAAQFYGNGALWPRIADANGLRNTQQLKVGARLRIP